MKISEYKILISQILIFFFLSNLIVDYVSCRKDISSSERLTLSDSTKEKLKNLRSPLYLEAYYSSDLPTEYTVRLELIREFLLEIEKQNPSMITLTQLDPNASAEIRKRALDAGLSPNEIQKASETSKSFQEAFMGLVIKYESQVEVISDFFFIEEAESQLVRILRRIQQKQKIQSIAIAADRGTFDIPLPGNGSGLATWGVFYHQALIEEYGSPLNLLLNEEIIPNQIKVLIVVGSPQWNESAKQRIDEFLLKGGRILFLLSPMQFQVIPVRNKDGLNFEGNKLAIPSSGYSHWNDLLNHYGFDLGTDLLFDFEHPVSLSKGNSLQKQYYPFWHYLFKSEGNLHQNHDLTNNIEMLILPWVSSIKLNQPNQPNLKYETILSTDRQVWRKQNVFSMNANQSFSDSEIERNRMSVAVIAEGKINPKYPSKVVPGDAKIFVLSSAFFVSDVLSLPEFRVMFRDANVGFLLNVIDYMLEDRDYILSREKNLAVIPLKAFTSQERNIYSLFNTLFLPLVLVLFAVRRVQKRYSGNKQ
jgi:ABC-type uncharacterized transport system involved in gliding motility auxiliary subunit